MYMCSLIALITKNYCNFFLVLRKTARLSLKFCCEDLRMSIFLSCCRHDVTALHCMRGYARKHACMPVFKVSCVPSPHCARIRRTVRSCLTCVSDVVRAHHVAALRACVARAARALLHGSPHRATVVLPPVPGAAGRAAAARRAATAGRQLSPQTRRAGEKETAADERSGHCQSTRPSQQ